MPKQQYPWLLAMTMLAAHQLTHTADIDTKDTGPAWTDITARLGRLQDSSARSANDAAMAAALLVLLFIWLWNCAKYRANLACFVQNRAKNHQNNAPPFFGPSSAETSAVIGFANLGANFSSPTGLCQMISSPTQTKD